MVPTPSYKAECWGMFYDAESKPQLCYKHFHWFQYFQLIYLRSRHPSKVFTPRSGRIAYNILILFTLYCIQDCQTTFSQTGGWIRWYRSSVDVDVVLFDGCCFAYGLSACSAGRKSCGYVGLVNKVRMAVCAGLLRCCFCKQSWHASRLEHLRIYSLRSVCIS